MSADKCKVMVLRGKKVRYMRSLWVGGNWSMSQSLSNWSLCSMNKVQIARNVLGSGEWEKSCRYDHISCECCRDTA